MLPRIYITEKYGVQPHIKSVLNIGSASGHTGAEFPEYCASKGKVNYDLTKAAIEKDCSIYAVAILGRVSITVSDSINVKVESNSIFGDFSNRTTDREDVPTLCVSGKCLFGKVEIDRQ